MSFLQKIMDVMEVFDSRSNPLVNYEMNSRDKGIPNYSPRKRYRWYKSKVFNCKAKRTRAHKKSMRHVENMYEKLHA